MTETYGKLIRKARLERRWSQEYLGRRMHTSGPTISRWELEKVRPDIDQMEALSLLLGIPLDTLIEGGGVRLRPSPEGKLYPPLLEELGQMTLGEQKALYDFFETARRAASRSDRQSPGPQPPG